MKSRIDNIKQSRGRPPVESEAVTVRIAVDGLREIDDWRRQQEDLPGRPEAIRRLVELGLSKTSDQPRVLSTSAKSAARAAELTAKAGNRPKKR